MTLQVLASVLAVVRIANLQKRAAEKGCLRDKSFSAADANVPTFLNAHFEELDSTFLRLLSRLVLGGPWAAKKGLCRSRRPRQPEVG
jgi:hypothetical protein